MRVFWIGLNLVLGLAQCALAAPPSSQAPPAEPIQALDVLGRFRFATKAPAAVDVRWASKDSIYVLRGMSGLREYKLDEGLPLVKQVLPGQEQLSNIPKLVSFGASDAYVVGVSGVTSYVIREAGSGGGAIDAAIQRVSGGGVSDIDIQGSEIVLLGTPSHDEFIEHSYSKFLWKARIESGRIGDYKVILEDESLQRKPGGRSVATYFRVRAGSVRFLADGDLLVYPGFRRELLLVSSTGKIKTRWDLDALDVVDQRSDLPEGEENESSQSRARRWSSEGVSVDELFVYGKDTPALVVRDFEKGKPVWDLVLLEGEEIRRFRIPLASPTVFAYVKADANEHGEILVLVGDRGFRMQETLDDEQVLKLALPVGTDAARESNSPKEAQ